MMVKFFLPNQGLADIAFDYHVGFRLRSTRNQRYECHLGIPRLRI